MSSISVIVPTLGRAEDILEFVDSLKNQSICPDELVVVDAGPDDSLKDTLKNALHNSSIELQYAKSEPGTSLQRNVAMDLAVGDIFFFFDDDVVLEPDYIEKTIQCFDRDCEPKVGGVLGTFNSPYSMPKWRRTYAKLFRMTHLCDGDKATLMSSGGVKWLIEPSTVVEVPVCSGGRVAYRRECFENERWAEFLPGYTMSEDVEISHRISKEWTLVQTPHAKLFHKSSPIGRNKVGDRIARIIYSRFYFFSRHMPKTPRRLTAYALWNVGNTGLYLNRAVLNKSESIDIAKGIAKGYRLCLSDIINR